LEKEKEELKLQNEKKEQELKKKKQQDAEKKNEIQKTRAQSLFSPFLGILGRSKSGDNKSVSSVASKQSKIGTLEFDNSVSDAFESLLNVSNTSSGWILFGYDQPQGGTKVQVKAKGTGYDNFLKHLEDSTALHAVYKVTVVEAARRSHKQVFITWTGSLGAIKRAKVVSNVELFKKYFNGLHVDVQAKSKDELKNQIVQKLESSKGAIKILDYEF
jgi:hypothetical protein